MFIHLTGILFLKTTSTAKIQSSNLHLKIIVHPAKISTPTFTHQRLLICELKKVDKKVCKNRNKFYCFL